MNKGLVLVVSILGIFLLAFLYGVSDSGRLIRDYGIYSSGISDEEVKGIWCRGWDFGDGGSYLQIGDKEYCGDVEVDMKCRFTNRGDHCMISLSGDKKNE